MESSSNYSNAGHSGSNNYSNGNNEIVTGNGTGLRAATTIGTIVVRSGPIQMVIALLQSGDRIHVKVVEIEPKLTSLGENIEQAVHLQSEHDELLKQLQGMPTPIEEFGRKADKLLASKRISADLVGAMADTLIIAWEDILRLLHDRKHLLDLCANFHEKLGSCRGKIASLEVACNDTMIPIEVEAVQEFLNKFKQLRIDMLSTVMSTLKEGNELLAQLQEISQLGTLDTRPEHIKRDALRAVHQVQEWLENLHDKRKILESAWLTRKTQLEQCLALAILAKDLDDVERILKTNRNHLSCVFSLGECDVTAGDSQQEYSALKHDALILRDRAIRITVATEKLISSGCFAGDEACSRAYNILSNCTEYLEMIDQREHWLCQSKEFFIKAGKTLSVLEKLEIELSSQKCPSNTPESFAMFTKVLKDVRAFTEEPLRLGYSILDEVGRTKPETHGVKRVLDEIENRKIYIEGICESSSEEKIKTEQALNMFLEEHNEILEWLTKISNHFLFEHKSLGTNLQQCKSFLSVHHQLMQDLERRGEHINSLLENIKHILESFDPQQRYDVDSKAESVHQHWILLKNIVLKRVDLVSMLIEFFEKAEHLTQFFDRLETDLKDYPEENKLNRLESIWFDIKNEYGKLKTIGHQFMNSKVADLHLEMKSSCSAVEDTLNSFSNRQLDVTTSLENWTTTIVEKREIEIILEKIMNENNESVSKATNVDADLYPVFTSASEDAQCLQDETNDKLKTINIDMEKSKDEIQQRITTTTSIQTTDPETKQKIDQVIQNLYTLRSKLDSIQNDYKTLITNICSFLENLIILRNIIDEQKFKQEQQQQQQQQKQQQYSNQNNNNNNYNNINNNNRINGDTDNNNQSQFDSLHRESVENLEHVVTEHEHFREKCMDRFRLLITQSETLIDRVRVLEPPGARENDTDRILKLLENLRIHFETFTANRMSELDKLKKFNQFKNDLNDINKNLYSVSGQLSDIHEQSIDSLASAKTTSLAFEYFERTIELLEKRIEEFITSSEPLPASYPEFSPEINDDLSKLQSNWQEFKDQMKSERGALNATNEYFSLVEKIEAEYREINYFFSSVTNKIPYLKEPCEAGNLVNDIENYTSTRQGPLLEKLEKVLILSKEVNNEHIVSKLHLDVTGMFQSFVKLKSDIRVVEDRLKLEDRIREQQAKVEQDRLAADKLRKELELNELLIGIQYAPPAFLKMLQDIIVVEGQRVVFECEVTGRPEPTVEWFKGGISIQNNPDYKTSYMNGICTLTIEEVFEADANERFVCVASNSVGVAETFGLLSVKENAAEVAMIPPKIVRFLENGIAREGSSFHFSCAVTGNPLPTVQWYKNDKCIDDSRDYVITYNNGEALLVFDEVFLEDDAIYTCNATNPVGFVHCSAKLTVEPLEPTEVPFIRTPLSNVMARVGHKLKLECTLGGIPKPEIYWTHNGKPLVATGRDIKYEDDRVTLTIPEAYPKDAGVYVIIAKNLAGEAYSSCNVSVKGRLPNETSDSELASDMEPVKPSVQLTLKDVAIFEGKSVRLDCVIVGQPEPEVIWYHNDQPIKESSDVQLLFQGDRCSLVIREAYLEDGGQYKVVAINSAGEASSSCTLKVTPLNIAEPATRMQNAIPNDRQAKFEKLLSDVLAAEGDTVELECAASGEQPLNAKWYLTNKELSASDRTEFYSDPLTGTFKLIFKNVSVDDKGVYTVKVSNQYGEAKCFSHLIVKSVNGTPDNQRAEQQTEIEERHISPIFTELFSNQTAHIGDVVKFECIVKGKPTPKIRWYFNDQPVHGKNFLISTSGDRQVLTIPEANTETIGKVACVAENDIGKATCAGYLALSDAIDILPSTADVKTMSQEHNTDSSRVTIKKQVFTTISTSQVNTYEGNLPQTEIHTSSAHIDQSLKQLGQQKPVSIETHQYQEMHKANDQPATVHQKSTVVVQKLDEPSSPKIVRKQIPPKFTSELISKIVDQGSNVTLEASYEGFPTPEIHIEKNGEILFPAGGIKITNKLNRVTVEIQNVGVQDAGRYSVVAANPIGQSTCTADIVVKKPIFPPVFGHRLQPKIVKPGERAVLEVEVSGTPDPTVTWYKDNKPIKDAGVSFYQLRSSGTTHTLIIENAKLTDSGKFMVKATNSGGESQNIADFHVVEPQPDKVVEVVKTIVYTDVNDFKQEPLKVQPPSFHKTSTDIATETERHGVTESKITTEHRCTTEATMRLEHNLAFNDLPTLTRTPQSQMKLLPQQLPAEQPQQPQPQQIQPLQKPILPPSTQNYERNELNHKTVSTNTVTSKMITDSTQTPPQVPQKPTPIEPIRNTIDSHSKSAFEYFKKVEVTESQPVASAIRFQAPSIDQKYKKFDDIPKLDIDIQKDIPKVSPATADRFNLVPGSPPEMCFIPQSEYQKETLHITDKIKNIEKVSKQQQQQQQQHPIPQLPKTVPIEILPMSTKEETRSMTSFRKEVRIEYPEPILRPRASLDLTHSHILDRATSPKPSAEGIAMEKLWASPKPFEYESCQSDVEYDNKYQVYMSASETEPDFPSHSKSINETKKIFEQKIQEQEIVPELKAPILVQQAVSKPTPVPLAKCEINDLDLNLQPGSPPEICFAPKPEDRRRSLVESMEESLEKDLLKGPSKVLPHSVPTITPPIPQMTDLSSQKKVPSFKPITVTYHQPTITQTVDSKQFKPPPPVVPTKLLRSEFYESDYESDRYKYSGSESDETSHRFANRPKSMEIPISPFKSSGYVADTEEPGYKQFSSINESRQIFESKDISNQSSKDTFKQNGFAPFQSTEYKEFRKSTISKTISSESKSSSQMQQIQKEPSKPIKMRIPPPASPSKFVKMEMRDTDYSSGYDEKIQPVWQPYDSDSEIKGYRPVRIQFTPTPTKKIYLGSEHIQSPANFDQPPSFDGPPRPKFEPIRTEPLPPKAQPQLHKPKPVTAKFIAATAQSTAPKTTMYYTAVTGAPLHLAKAATETRNTMHMKESSETCQRIVNMEQTKRVIHFENEKTTSYGIPPDQLPFTAATSGRSGTPRANIRPIATPTKFIPGEFKESDYESEVDSAKIRPLWTPRSDYDDPRYRHVDPPQPGRSMSVPRSYEGVLSPMQFDHGPQMPSKILVQVPENQRTTQTLDRYSSTHKTHSRHTTRDDMNLKIGSPPKYGYIETKATNQVKDLGSSFRQKSHQFIDDLAKDLRTTSHSIRPGFKRAPSEGDNNPQAYRNESRVSQYGTKCVDPNTGLIYFKYDFGYEFGILFPGEGKKFIGGKSKTNVNTKDGQNNTVPINNYPFKLPLDGDIIIPVQHEHTTQTSKPTIHHHKQHHQHHQQHQQPQQFLQQNGHSNVETGNTGHGNQTNDGRLRSQCNRQPIAIDINIDRLHSNDNLPKTLLQSVPELPSTIPVNAHLNRDEYPKKPPVFITPLKDIAVVSGQTARFECIVQSDPNTQVIWSKNLVPLEASQKYLIEFRNGVCRLTIPQAYPCDAGSYICTATNEFGSATTSAEFIVPGNNRGNRF